MFNEAHLKLTGYMNKQNYLACRSDRPDTLEGRPLHAKKLSVEAGVGTNGLEDFQLIRNEH